MSRPRPVGTRLVRGSGSVDPASSLPRVLCFGDSLTEGYHRHNVAGGPVYMHPYAMRMIATLNESQHSSSGQAAAAKAAAAAAEASSRPAICTVEESGWSGELSNSMVPRLRECLDAATAAGKPYSLVILLGGTNDVAYCVPPEQIVQQLRALHALCHAHSPTTRSIAMTVPEIAPLGPPAAAGGRVDDEQREMDKQLGRINAALQSGFEGVPPAPAGSVAAMADASRFDKTRYSVLDLHSLMAQWSPAPAPLAPSAPWRHNSEGWWDVDRVHFSINGYERIGQLLAEFIQKHSFLLQLDPKAAANGPGAADEAVAAGAPAEGKLAAL